MNCRVFYLALLIFVFTTGCKKNNGNKQKLTTYNIAALFSLTGNWSSLGNTSKEVLNIAIADVNTYLAERGSSVRFAATVYDTKLDVELAKTHLQTAIKDLNVKFVLGPQSSAEVSSVINMANSNNLLLISHSSTASSLAIPNDAVFRFCPGDGPEGLAISRTMFQSGKRVMITLARNDAGNLGLQSSVTANFTALGGQIDAMPVYSTTIADFTSVLQQLKTKVQQQVAVHGASKVGIYLASFDECSILFRQAFNDPVLSSVNWYGGDGVVLSAALLADIDARRFANTVSFFAPNFGLPQQAHPKLSSIAAAVRAKAGIDPDAYAISVYDAVWVLATTIADYPSTVADFNTLKVRFREQANRYYGVSGPLLLDVNGDRVTGAFDYWGIVNDNGVFSWKVVGKSN